MAQITLYLDEETAARMKKAAKAAGVSQSRWVAELVRRKTASEWPEAVKRLAGAWTEIETAEKLRKGIGKDVPRQRF
jgi:hypothetical protein